MSTNLKYYAVSVSQTVTKAGGRLRFVDFVTPAGNGSAQVLILREGASATGNIVFKMFANSGARNDIFMADHGIRFNDGLYVEMPTSANATILVG
jgi:hypothetical protein